MDGTAQSKLLDLPPELRLMIYGFTFEGLDGQLTHPEDAKDLEPINVL